MIQNGGRPLNKDELLKRCKSSVYYQNICDTDSQRMREKYIRNIIKYHPDKNPQIHEKVYNTITAKINQCHENIYRAGHTAAQQSDCYDAYKEIAQRNIR
jgi:hypothetical protein